MVKKKTVVVEMREVQEVEPPDDYKDIEIYPAASEITVQNSPFLRPNVIKGPYRSVEHYLDVQFRLLREDFVAPLRNGICKYLKDPRERLENIKIYNRIQFLTEETVADLVCYRIKFDFNTKKNFSIPENSRRFMYGALLCFTPDKFRTLLFGKVVKRDYEDCLKLGQLIVGFDPDINLPAKLLELDFLMVESSVYFEPYYQVLKALKTIKAEAFPMETYIIDVETQTAPPRYLITLDPQFYTIQSKKIFPLDWAEGEIRGLNTSQSKAFRAALTKEFAIIQGPPGTGKTFLGLKIAHTLLANKGVWYKKSPMLVICFTNHALDQFLEGLLPATNQIVRVGGQSKNTKLEQFNIRKKRSYMGGFTTVVREKKIELKNHVSEISTINANLLLIEKNVGVFEFTIFEGVVPDFNRSWFKNATNEDIHTWLFGGLEFRRFNPEERRDVQANQRVEIPEETTPVVVVEEENVDFFDDDIFEKVPVEDITQLMSLETCQRKLNGLFNQWETLAGLELDDWMRIQQEDRINFEIYKAENELEYLKVRLEEGKFNRQPPQFVNIHEPHRMPPDDRWRLYFHWLSLYQEKLKRDLVEYSREFRRCYNVYNQLASMEDAEIMKDSLVVGMTTTSAARLNTSLQTLKSPIVIVEEAAEVLEAHIITALTAHCQHLILIGDHQQLKPSTADYKVEKKFQLGISLFERMVINNIQCHTLDVQHRMRPEISRLIRPTIYPVLHDHESVMERPPVAGVDKCIYFIDHREQEQLCQDNSKKNVHEARFLILFARHLILNGYKPENITILAAYLGQMFEMQREKKKCNVQLQDVRIAVLDNYQGEESDIILLSLVRSNEENKIGFLKEENRVCVALSRARNGFYIMGNMKQLCDNSKIWPKIHETLKGQEAVGEALTLRCQVHPDKLNSVRTAEDFVRFPEGGCDLICEALLKCGHICKQLCHVEDRAHDNKRCSEKCELLLCENPKHKCKKLCYEKCGPCTYPVERTLPCSHTVFIDCHIDPEVHKCTVMLEGVELPCGHVTRKPCHADAEKFECPFPCDSRVEPCGHACSKSCHFRDDPDHLLYKCMKPCDRPLKGCTMTEGEQHLCRKMCFDECGECAVFVDKKRNKCGHTFKVSCNTDLDTIKCKKPCRKTMPCGHECKRECDEPCGHCLEKVAKRAPECNHEIRIECYKNPAREFCEGKCPRLLNCGHQCTKTCYQECTKRCRVKVDCSIRGPCGHIIQKIECYQKDTVDQTLLSKLCTEKCNFKLACEHFCSGSCGSCSQGRLHQRCQEKCGVPLVCDHECPIPCRQACQPCQMQCIYRCKHSKCKKKCGDPCTRCKENCPRRCNHQQCKRKCWEICNVPPCNKPCQKKLKCGHDCVGFCGDVCPPLCRVCDHEELTTVFLGSEDEEDAVYVMLVDCKHVFEAGDLDRWMEMDQDQIKPKVCPKCKTHIIRTERYSEAIKKNVLDLTKVKMMYYGNEKENENKRRVLEKELYMIESDSIFQSEKLLSLLSTIFDTLASVRNKHRQYINKMDLDAIETKMSMLRNIHRVLRKGGCDSTINFLLSGKQLDLIVEVMSRYENSITKQEIDDITLETDRLLRFVQLEDIKRKFVSYIEFSNKNDQSSKALQIKNQLENYQRYDRKQDELIKSKLEELCKSISSSIQITDAERVSIVQAVGLTKGHWFKCPNGHPYAIGECGGAMEVSKCYECGVAIGGTNHRLLSGQAVATEMDGASHAAWSDTANMANYQL